MSASTKCHLWRDQKAKKKKGIQVNRNRHRSSGVRCERWRTIPRGNKPEDGSAQQQRPHAPLPQNANPNPVVCGGIRHGARGPPVSGSPPPYWGPPVSDAILSAFPSVQRVRSLLRCSFLPAKLDVQTWDEIRCSKLGTFSTDPIYVRPCYILEWMSNNCFFF